MYSKFSLAVKYLHYYLTASNGKGHGVHPPFAYDFITKVLNNKSAEQAYNTVEQLRNQLLADNTLLTIEDFGAGSITKASNQRTIASIAKHAAKPKKYGQLLYRIVQYYGHRNIIELGTSLGISTAYMAMANSFANVVTCEGSSTIAEKAKQNFERIHAGNITLLEGEFQTSYIKALKLMPSIDLLFIDGNHQYAPTLQYFEMALPKLHEESMVIFDDIHWSGDMEKAWEAIKTHPGISETIDLFFIGIVFFRKAQKAPQDFTIRF